MGEITFGLIAGEFIKFSAYKPFRRFHIELNSFVTSNTLIVEYWDGTIWKPLTVSDYTLNFSKSGFMDFDPPSDWVEIDGYYTIRMSFALDIVSCKLNGINFLFSNDDDLREELLCYSNYIDSLGITSLASLHQASRNEIIEGLNKQGKTKRTTAEIRVRLDAIDALIPDELRQASKYLTLAKMFFNLSDATDDKYYQKYKDYLVMSDSARNLYYLTLDLDDDGAISSEERSNFNTISVTRI